MKPKEPLLSLMLSIFYPGLGQIYSGYTFRGILFIIVPLLIGSALLWYVVQPETKIYVWMIGILIIGVGFVIYVLVDSYQCSKRYNKENNLERKITTGKRVLYIIGILICLFVVDLSDLFGKPVANYIRENVVQAYKIPSGAMRLTLMENDRLFVDKKIYKKEKPKRGDVAVFIYPQDSSKDFIKRIVGLPGEQIEIRDGRLIVNGQELDSSLTLFNHNYYNRGEYGKEGVPVTVPLDAYFVLGDNSGSSHDSRYWGFVPAKNILGKAYKIYYPFDRSGPIK